MPCMVLFYSIYNSKDFLLLTVLCNHKTTTVCMMIHLGPAKHKRKTHSNYEESDIFSQHFSDHQNFENKLTAISA